MIAYSWFFYALGAAIFWGVGYAFSEKIMGKGVSPEVLMLIYAACAVPSYIALTIFNKTLKPSFENLANNQNLIIYTAIVAIAFVLGNVFIFKGVAQKNATHASIIEMSYPIFVVFFSWLFFKEFHLNAATLIGAALIFTGVVLVYVKS